MSPETGHDSSNKPAPSRLAGPLPRPTSQQLLSTTVRCGEACADHPGQALLHSHGDLSAPPVGESLRASIRMLPGRELRSEPDHSLHDRVWPPLGTPDHWSEADAVASHWAQKPCILVQLPVERLRAAIFSGANGVLGCDSDIEGSVTENYMSVVRTLNRIAQTQHKRYISSDSAIGIADPPRHIKRLPSLSRPSQTRVAVEW
jgi:hypothetical protein